MKTNQVSIAVIASLLLLAPAISRAAGTKLTVNCPTNIVVTATTDGGATVFYSVTASGGCFPPPTVTTFPPSGSTFPIGTTTVTATVNDSCGDTNACSFTVTVNPPSYPALVLNCSSNLTVTAASSNGAAVFFNVTASGGCSPPPFVSANPPSGSTFPLGITTVLVSASDTCGNSTNCSFTVTVNPPSYPPLVLNCSSNLTVTAASSNGAAVFFSVTASGGCSPPPFVSANPPSGSTFPLGLTTVLVSASDTCGHSTNCSFTVTVNPPSYPPIVLTCSQNVTVTATGTNNGAAVFFTSSAYGGCSSPLTLSSVPPSGSFFPIGTNLVTTTASDSCGNGTNCSFTVTVNPPSYPPIVLTCSQNVTVTATGTNNGAAVFFTSSAYGGCSSPLTLSSVPPSGSFFPIGTNLVTTIASDSCGNSTNCSFTVTVNPPSYPLADLVVTKAVSTNSAGPFTNSVTALPGQLIYFQISIANAGPANPTNILINDPLPPGLAYVASQQYPYNPSTGVWTIGTLTGNGTYFMYLDCVATNLGTFTNNATVPVPSGITDPNLSNNTASASVTVTLPPADLAVTKAVSTNPSGPYTNAITAYTGQTIYFQLGIANNGPANPTNIVINDPLPPGLTYVASQQYSYNTNTGVWTIGTLVGNGTYFMYLDCVAANQGTFTNVATVPVPGGVSDPNLSNNVAKASVQVYQVYSISGYVRGCQTNGPAIPHTTVNLSGSATGSTLTDTNGFYVFSNIIAGGTYTITPAQPANIFSPASATLTLNANTNLPVFLGSIAQIRGKLTYSTNGTGVAGALVNLTGAQTRAVMSDANGVYAFTNTPPGNYTVTPVATNGFTFTPTNATVAVSATNCVAQANFTAAARKVLLVALEVVQVIQDWSNSVPLIQAKRTFVRVHLQLPTNGPAVLIQGARLYANGLPGSPLPPYAPGRSPDFLVQTTNASALRGTFNNSLNFELPANWTAGSYPLVFVATNNVTVVPTNTVSANSSVQATFVPTVVPPLKFVGFNWTNWNNTNLQTVNAPIYDTVPARVTAVYPVPDVTATKSMLVAPGTLNVPKVIPNNLVTNGDVQTVYDWALLNANAKLLQMQSFDWLLSVYYGYTNWIYVGVLAGPTLGTYGWAGAYVTSSNTLAQRAQNVSASFLQTILYGNNSARQTIPHEIGHNLGFPHDFNYMIYGFYKKNGVTYTNVAAGTCNRGPLTAPQFPFFQPVPPPAGALQPTLGPMTNGAPNSVIYGLDTFTLVNFPGIEPVADPNNCFDIMSYCRGGSPLERWSSSYFYTGMRNTINTQFAAPPPRPGPGPVRNWRFIRGYVDPDNDVGGLEPSWSVSSTVSGPPPTPAAGDYVAALLDGNGTVIEAIPFEPVPFIVEETEAEEDLFSIPLIDDPTIKQVEIIDMLNSNLVSSLVAPTELPSVSSVTLTTTNGSAFTGTGPLVINWSASDADPNAQLTYLVQFSSDGGNSWDTLDVDWPSLSYQIDSLTLRATAQGLIRILASDGWNTSLPATSSLFTIPNHPPKVSINAPADGTILIADGQVVFDASAIDPQDGPLDGPNVQWSSSLDGILGNGAVLALEADLLSEGTHVITVTATDAEALSSSAQVTIQVVRQPPPTLAIQYIGNQILVSWPASQTNYLLESATSLAPSNWSPVTNTPVPADITQTVNLNLSNTNRFFRLLMP